MDSPVNYAPAAPCLARFQVLKNASDCTFAPSSKLWGCPDWAPELDLPGNIGRWRSSLEVFVSPCVHDSELDGLVLELPGSYGRTIADLTSTVVQVLLHVDDLNPPGFRCLQQTVEDPAWWFRLHGVELFPLTFAPCYPKSSSRYSFGVDHTYIVFQPRQASRRRLPLGDAERAQHVRDVIRERFASAGQRYDLAITLSPFEAHRFVKPIRYGDPPIEWWNQRAHGCLAFLHESEQAARSNDATGCLP